MLKDLGNMKLDKCIYIKNIVCTFKIQYKENFDNILNILNDVAYKPKKFHGIIIKNDEYGIKFMFFRGGSVNAVGIKSLTIFKKIGDIFIGIFKKNGIDVSIVSNPRITNIIATANVHSQINLASLDQYFDDIDYEPEVYSSAICKIKTYSGNIGTIILTNSGHIYCCGLKNLDELSNLINGFIQQLNELGFINLQNIPKFIYSNNCDLFMLKNEIEILEKND